jgi:hypothetical protein
VPTRTASPKAKPIKSKSGYDVHPSLTMVQNVIANMKEKTGRTLEEWVKFVNASGPKKEEDRRDWLKKVHGLGTNYSWWIAERSVGKGEEDTDPKAYLKTAEQWVDAMYSGAKEGLRPIYEELLKTARKLGKDIRVCPCKTMVPIYRENVIAEIKPSTRTRVDFGLALKNTKAKGRLIDTGGFAKKDRITHRVAITSVGEIDDEVKHWLKLAYDMNA